jgi:sugar lactone lactonase YvrE
MSTTRSTGHLTWRRALLTLAVTSTALAALALPAGAATTHGGASGDYTLTIEGGNAYPESISADSRYIYTGSIDTGTVYRGRVGSRTLEPFLPGGQDGRTEVTGVKTDGDRLLLAGAFTGQFFIYTDTGKLVASYTVPDTGEQTLVNDEVVAPDGDVYITDSFRAVIYRIPAAEVNAPATGVHRTLQVAYQLPDYVAGTSNGNGITTTPDGRSLIIGYWYSGALYKLTLATGEITKIDAPALTSADGIFRLGDTLYIDRSVNDEFATVQLSDNDTRGTVVSERTFPGIDTPTGITVSGNRLLVTNSQMNNYLYGDPLQSPVFTVESLPLH